MLLAEVGFEFVSLVAFSFRHPRETIEQPPERRNILRVAQRAGGCAMGVLFAARFVTSSQLPWCFEGKHSTSNKKCGASMSKDPSGACRWVRHVKKMRRSRERSRSDLRARCGRGKQLATRQAGANWNPNLSRSSKQRKI